MDRQRPQFHIFQALWSSNAHNNRPSLQMHSFTSESYRALKEREQKRRQQRKAVSKKWNKAQCGDVSSGFMSLGTALEMQHGSEWNDCTCVPELREPSAVQEDAQVRPNDPLHCLRPRSNSASAVFGNPSKAVARSLPVDISNTMTIGVPEPACSDGVPNKELDCEIIQEADVSSSATPADELDIIILDNASASVAQRGNVCLDKVDFVCQAFCPTPLHSDNSEQCGRRTQGNHASPANPVCLEPNPEHMLAAAMTTRRNEPIFAGALPSSQSHRTYRVGLGQEGRNFKSAPQTFWTKDLDEHLLHLRYVAQLDWCRVVKYFPEATLNDIKRRHRELTYARTTCDTVRTRHRPQVCKRETRARSSSKKNALEKKHYTVSHGSINAAKAKCKNAPQVRQRATKQYSAGRTVTDSTVTTCDNAFERTSRCGRKIRHPFRHKPSEGYI